MPLYHGLLIFVNNYKQIGIHNDKRCCILVMMENELVNRIAKEIKDRGWSIRELARRANISHTWISNVLSGQRPPTWDFCAAIAGALDESPEDVFRLAGLLPTLPPAVEEEEEAIRILRTLPPDVRAIAIRILRSLQADTSHTRSASTVTESSAPYSTRGEDRLEPYVEILGDLWDKAPDWKKKDIVDQLRLAVEEYERETARKKTQQKKKERQ